MTTQATWREFAKTAETLYLLFYQRKDNAIVSTAIHYPSGKITPEHGVLLAKQLKALCDIDQQLCLTLSRGRILLKKYKALVSSSAVVLDATPIEMARMQELLNGIGGLFGPYTSLLRALKRQSRTTEIGIALRYESDIQKSLRSIHDAVDKQHHSLFMQLRDSDHDDGAPPIYAYIARCGNQQECVVKLFAGAAHFLVPSTMMRFLADNGFPVEKHPDHARILARDNCWSWIRREYSPKRHLSDLASLVNELKSVVPDAGECMAGLNVLYEMEDRSISAHGLNGLFIALAPEIRSKGLSAFVKEYLRLMDDIGVEKKTNSRDNFARYCIVPLLKQRKILGGWEAIASALRKHPGVHPPEDIYFTVITTVARLAGPASFEEILGILDACEDRSPLICNVHKGTVLQTLIAKNILHNRNVKYLPSALNAVMKEARTNPDLAPRRNPELFIDALANQLVIEQRKSAPDSPERRMALAKRIDILQAGLLIHGTAPYPDHVWSPRQLLALPDTGLLPSASTGKTNEFLGFSSGRTSDVVFCSLTMFPTKTFAENSWGRRFFRVFFIIDPQYVRQHPAWFSARPPRAGEPAEYDAFVSAMRIPTRDEKTTAEMYSISTFTDGVSDQILHVGPIPMQHIIGIVIMDDTLFPSLLRVIGTLSKRYPLLAVPVYDKNGRLLWP